MNNCKSECDYGFFVLGPVFYYFCDSFKKYLEALSDARKETLVLYQSRAGIRLMELFKLYRTINSQKAFCEEKLFEVSRLSVLKACLHNDFEATRKILLAEFSGTSMGLFLSALDSDFQRFKGEEFWERPLGGQLFDQIYNSEDEVGDCLRSLFLCQSEYFDSYFRRLLGKNKRIILVDSGWRGTTQALLMRRYPDYQWCGVYFGRIKGHPEFSDYTKNMQGLYFDTNANCRWGFRCLTFTYNHLIESTLEPRVGSVLGYQKNNGIERPIYESIYNTNSGSDGFYSGVKMFFSSLENISSLPCSPFSSKLMIFWRYFFSVAFPSRRLARILGGISRSSNMGKSVDVDVLIEKTGGCYKEARSSRISRSLWKSGQIALEYPRPISLLFQLIYIIRFPIGK